MKLVLSAWLCIIICNVLIKLITFWDASRNRGDRLTWLELVGMQHLCICAAGLE